MTKTYRNKSVSDVGNTWTSVVTSPADKLSIINQLLIVDKGSSGVQFSVRIHDASEASDTLLVVGAQSGLDSTSFSGKIFLEPNDRLEVKCDTLGETVDVVCSSIEETPGRKINALVGSVGNTWTQVYECPPGGKSGIVSTFLVDRGTSGIQGSLRIFRSETSDTILIANELPIPAGENIAISDKIVLEEGDIIEALCNTISETMDVAINLINPITEGI